MRPTLRYTIAALCSWIALAAPTRAAPGDPATSPQIASAGEAEGKVVVYSTTDSAAVQPMLKDFAALHAKISVEYNDMNSTEVYNRFVSEAGAGSGSADLLWSSAMDLQLKLASDGHAQEYASPEAAHLPPWAVWKSQAFGTTFEPICFVYNKRLLKADEIPQSHADLVKLVRAKPDRFKGKLTSYDPERSGIGFLLLTQDARAEPDFWDAVKAYGAAGVKLYTSTGAMLERISSGEHLLGFSAAVASAAPGDPATAPEVVSAAEREGQLVVYSSTDSAAVQPMLKDFAALYPKIKVEYDDMNTTELYNRFVSEAAAGGGSGDLLWSSAINLSV